MNGRCSDLTKHWCWDTHTAERAEQALRYKKEVHNELKPLPHGLFFLANIFACAQLNEKPEMNLIVYYSDILACPKIIRGREHVEQRGDFLCKLSDSQLLAFLVDKKIKSACFFFLHAMWKGPEQTLMRKEIVAISTHEYSFNFVYRLILNMNG